jgi:pimeloyl-ACP methyl ester carboxylesterase
MGTDPKGVSARTDAPQEGTVVLHTAGAPETSLRYRHAGQGPPLLWLHWLWGEPGWMPHHQGLAEQFHVYAPDLPGYGQSALPEWVRTPHDLAVVLLRFLEALALERPSVVGSCLGGWVAAELALLRPERLSQLVLIDPLGLVTDWTKVPNIFYTDPARLRNYFFSQPDHAQARAYVPDLMHWGDVFLHNRETSSRLVFDPYLHSRTLVYHLFLISTPTLILWGEHDPLLGPEHAPLWTSHLPDARSLAIPGAGHLPYVEKADAVLAAIRTFVTGDRPQGARQ